MHHIKKHVFENINRNDADNLTDLLSKSYILLRLVNDPHSIHDVSARKKVVNYNAKIADNSPDTILNNIKMGRKSIDIPSITPIPLRRKELDSYDSQKNGSIQTKIANNYSLRMKAPSNINNWYGAIISERNETYLPKIKSNNNISADMKQINTTLDETNRVVSRIDNINSQTPLTHKRINFEPR